MPKRAIAAIAALFIASFIALIPAAAQQRGPDLGQAIAAQQRHTPELMARPGVVGTAVGLTAAGQPAVLVLTEGPAVAGIPRTLDGVPVEVHVTGAISALGHRPGHGDGSGAGSGGSTLRPTDRWPRPVPIGVSTGNAGSCSAGTIGARVKDASGNVLALSNNHVYALENAAAPGSEVLQPGLYDTGCAYNPNNVLGNLSAYVPIVFSTSASNEIDAAIASSTTGNLGNSTPPNGYGTPRNGTVAPTLNQAVQKYGRTTSLTKGRIVGVNATIDVRYSSGTARFVHQIVILGSKPFLRPGDSGAVVVTDPGRNPVGLAFAASSNGYAFANEIDRVLAAFNVTIDGAP